MGKVLPPQEIKRFDLGVTSEIRGSNNRFSSMVKNFDIHTYGNKLVPLRSSEAGDASASSTAGVRNFCIARLNATPTYALYGLARDSADSRAEVFYKNLNLNANGLSDDDWTATAANLETTGTVMNPVDFNLFVFYENRNLIYGLRDSRYIWSYSPSGGGFTSTAKDLNAYTDIFSTSVAHVIQGLVHSKDDILYLAFDNWIIKNNAGTFTAGTAPALTLPAHFKVTSLSERGNYLAVSCAPKSGFGKSVVYLWDRDATLTTLSESIDWGEGELFATEELDGTLIGVTNSGKGAVNNQRLVFRYLDGNVSKVIDQLISQEVSSLASITSIYAKYKYNNAIYFVFGMNFYDGEEQLGIWKLGKNKSGNLALSLDRTLENDTTGITITFFHGFIVVGDFIFASYNQNGTITVRKTIAKGGSGEYSATSVLGTLVQNEGDSSITKQLKAITVLTEPLPAAGQVVLKYKKDADIDGSTYTTIFTNTTDDSIRNTATTTVQYKEIIFRIESTGGAVITGLKWKPEVVDNDVA